MVSIAAQLHILYIGGSRLDLDMLSSISPEHVMMFISGQELFRPMRLAFNKSIDDKRLELSSVSEPCSNMFINNVKASYVSRLVQQYASVIQSSICNILGVSYRQPIMVAAIL